MSLNNMSDFLPLPLVAGAAIWAATAHLFVAPILADRVFQFDHRTACVAFVAANIKRETSDLIAQKAPASSAATTAPRMVIELLRQLPFGQRRNPYGSSPIEELIELSEIPARAAKDAFETARRRLIKSANEDIAKAPDSCSCRAKLAFSQNHLAWSVWAGSGGLIKRPAIDAYASDIMAPHGRERCRRRVS